MKLTKNIFFLICLLASFKAYSIKDLTTGSLSGQNLTSGGSIQVDDAQYGYMISNPSWSSQFTNHKNKVAIKLGFEKEDRTFFGTSYQATVELIIKSWDANGNPLPDIPKTLSVEHDMDPNVVVNDVDLFLLPNEAYSVKVEVLNTTNTLSPYRELELLVELETERYFVFNPATDVITGENISLETNYFNVSWNPVMTAEFYELEYTFITDYNTSSPITDYDFGRNSTRIRIDETYHRIPLLYQKGNFIYRVRPVGRAGTNFDYEYYGNWTLPESGNIAGVSSSNKLYINEHLNATKNWSSSTFFMQDGSRIDNVSYSDGLGRYRQGIVKDNENKQIMVDNTYYDFHGRAVISHLPTPVNENEALVFIPDFNKTSDNLDGYGPKNFDYDGNDVTCTYTNAEPMGNGTGAGYYYSSNNQDIEGAQKYVPDAKGFPFARVQYTPDNSGRIARISGAGIDHNIESGHEVKIQYERVTHEEISKLFGSNVGKDSEYMRVTRTDANGQKTTQIYNSSGQVIASYLLGGTATSLTALDNNNGPTNVETILSEGYGESEITATTFNFSNTMVAEASGEIKLKYSITPEEYNYANNGCMPTDICYDCVYDLEISVYEEVDGCSDGTPIFTKTETFSGLPVDFECNGGPLLIDYPDMTFTATEGKTYIINKNLSINEDVIEEYVCNYIDNYTCADDYQTIYTGIYNSTNLNDCNTPIANNPPSNPSACEIREAMMLNDMSPSGQYGLIFDSNFDIDPSLYPLSIFNDNNQLPSGIAWNDPSIVYHYENGNTFIVPAGMTVQDFIQDHWDANFAKDLLIYHPEYCYLSFCNDNVSSHNYDDEIRGVNEFSVACAGGYFDPVQNLSSSISSNPWMSYVFGSCVDATGGVNDPFFQPTGDGFPLLSHFQNELNEFVKIDGGTANITIWEAAVTQVRCPEIYLDEAGNPRPLSEIKRIEIEACLGADITECELNAIWNQYKTLYLSAKLRFYSVVETDYTMANKCYNNCIGNQNFSITTNSFDCYPFLSGTCTGGKYDGDQDPDQPCSNPGLYVNKNSIFFQFDEANFNPLTPTQISGIIQNAQAQSTAACATDCNEKADEWMIALSGCNLTPQQEADIRADLIELCIAGCDYNSFGASELPSGVVSNSGFNSFKEIILHHVGGEDNLCSDLLINDPRPYGQSETPQTSILDDCGCDKLLTIEYYFNQGDISQIGNSQTIEEAYEYMYGYIPPQNMDNMLCACASAFDLNGTGAYHPINNNSWNLASTNYLEQRHIGVSDILSCNKCFDCKAIQDEYALFLTRFSHVPNFENETNYYTLFENYMNNALNFHLSSAEYEIFLENCSSSLSNPVCYPSSEFQSLVHVWDLLAKLGQLEVSSSSPIDLEQYIPYNYSEFKQGQTEHFYWGEVATNKLIMNYGSSASSCDITIILPAGSSLTFDKIIGFSDLIPLNEGCDNNSEFQVTAWYFYCGEKVSIDLTGFSDCVPTSECFCGPSADLLCDDNDIFLGSDCWQDQFLIMASNAEDVFTQGMDDIKDDFRADMLEHCRLAFATESFKKNADVNRYQHTLLQYDRVGNLVQTIPPNGVDLTFGGIPVSDIGNTANFTTPNHSMQSDYRYNTFGQIVESKSPDEGVANYWYDFYGRMVASQNSEQAPDGKYFYTLYDEFGRVVEYGQVFELDYPLTETILNGLNGEFDAWVATGTKQEWNRIFYDEEMNQTIPTKFKSGTQDNLRLRVASITYYVQHQTDYQLYDYATHYSYDNEGNIIESIQDAQQIGNFGLDDLRYISTQYDFEKITGKIREIIHQEGRPDEIGYSYDYDRNHRLKDVYSLSRGVFKTLESKYHYYEHGPMAREELGEKQVQGVDMVYTINGWLKGVNSNTLDKTRDPGVDNSNGYNTSNTDIHSGFAGDIYGFTLGYFNGDYSSIAESTPGYIDFEAETASSAFQNGTKQLFNGAISSSVNAINGLDILGYNYEYDQLYRIKKMNVYKDIDVVNNNWNNSVATQDYNTEYTYDPSGNIQSLKRNALGSTQLDMDDFTYNYDSGLKQNQLLSVSDGVTNSPYNEDIKDGQSANNYDYDDLGRLTQDLSEGIQNIEWNSRNLVKKITYSNGKSIEYVYNAQGVRVLKILNEVAPAELTYYYYGLDGSGSSISYYKLDPATSDAFIEEQYIYGNGRIGTWGRNKQILDNAVLVDDTPVDDIFDFQRGERQFELVNHLGNVLSTVSDRKIGYDDIGGDDIVDTYTANQIFYADYYPFGMQMPGRTGGDNYRFSYNGMESDSEVKGNGNSYTTSFRQYDPRLGRWSKPDDVNHAQFSPYVGMDNKPISMSDNNGKNAIGKVKYKTIKRNGKRVKVIKSIKIKARIYFYGGGASDESAQAIASDIQKNLNESNLFLFDYETLDEIEIEWVIEGKSITEKQAKRKIKMNQFTKNYRDNFIRLESTKGRKLKSDQTGKSGNFEVSSTTDAYGSISSIHPNIDEDEEVEPGGNTGYWNIDALYKKDGDVGKDYQPGESTHEFIHSLGFRDENNPHMINNPDKPGLDGTPQAGHTANQNSMMASSNPNNVTKLSQDDFFKINTNYDYIVGEKKRKKFKLGSLQKVNGASRTEYHNADGSTPSEQGAMTGNDEQGSLNSDVENNN